MSQYKNHPGHTAAQAFVESVKHATLASTSLSPPPLVYNNASAAAAAPSTVPTIASMKSHQRTISDIPSSIVRKSNNFADDDDEEDDDSMPPLDAPHHEDDDSDGLSSVCSSDIFEPARAEDTGFRVRSWFLTLFRDDGFPKIPKDRLKYYALTKEVCPSNGRIHWHMMAEFIEKISIACIKREFGDNTINCQVRKGTVEQCRAYIYKESSRFPGFEVIEVGDIPMQGKRSDLDFMVDAIFEGATKKQLLHHGGGNVLRHLGLIDRAQRAVHGKDSMDNFILQKHRVLKRVNEKRSTEGKTTLLMSEAFHLLPLVEDKVSAETLVELDKEFYNAPSADAPPNHINVLETCVQDMLQATLLEALEKKKSKKSKESKTETASVVSEKKRGRPKKILTPDSLVKVYVNPFNEKFYDRTIISIADATVLFLEQDIIPQIQSEEFEDMLIDAGVNPDHQESTHAFILNMLDSNARDAIRHYIDMAHRDGCKEDVIRAIFPGVYKAVIATGKIAVLVKKELGF